MKARANLATLLPGLLILSLFVSGTSAGGCTGCKTGYVFDTSSFIIKSYSGSGSGMSNSACKKKCQQNNYCYGYTAGASAHGSRRYWSCDLYDSNVQSFPLVSDASGSGVSCTGRCT